MRRLRNVQDLMVPAVAEAIDQLALKPEDAGVARLAQRYAAQIDESAQIAADLAEATAAAGSDAGEYDRRMLTALAKRVDAQAVLAELGPKLLAALESLGASPRARAAQVKGGATGGSNAGTGRLAAIRSARTG